MKRGIAKQGMIKRRSGIFLVLATGFAWAWINSAAATEVYTWTDESGIVHYSDVPIDPENTPIITIEGADRVQTAETPALAEEGELTVAQQRRKQIADTQKARKKSQEEIDNLCAQYRERLAKAEPARRIEMINDQGEKIRLDDDQRMEIIDESKDFIAKNCE